jgi:hypothetical protein
MRSFGLTALFVAAAACGSFKAAIPAGAADSGPPGGSSDDGAAPAIDASPPNDAREAEVPSPDAGCAPACAGRACGKDPACGTTCGVCPQGQACDETSSAVSCKPATLTWEVDGVVVAEFATFEAYYTTSQDAYALDFPHWGRSIQIGLPAHPSTGTLASCPSGGSASLALITSDNSWAGLDALPLRWKNLIFASCGAQSSGDTVTARDLTITAVSPARVAGTYDVVVEGAGPRAGSTLHAHGVFDIAPTPM